MPTTAKKEVVTSFEHVERPVHEAFTEEVHLFMHVHLRGYDKEGDGKQMHADYYDKYGAPMKLEESWLEGYRDVERQLSHHFNACINPCIPFPKPAATAGGTHLYDMHHFDKPWNWTGFVPEQKKWCCYDKFFQNRHFISLRGNEVQNNLWDYDPHEEDPNSKDWDMKYQQLIPRDQYRGGYFYYKNPWGRYVHIISLKSVAPAPTYCKRYNYIVHPLAYRASVNDLPDDSVDAMQWAICNVNSREHNKVPYGHSKQKTFPAFGDDQLDKWGDKNHGIEIFNDFTYYYSASPLKEEGDKWLGGNGFLHDEPGTTKNNFIHWFNSYPHEMGEFLVETCLRHGNYLHILSANDAMYERNKVEVQHADPKSPQTTNLITNFNQHPLSEIKDRHNKTGKLQSALQKRSDECKEFLGKMPYLDDTVFGYTTLIDPHKDIKTSIYGGHPHDQIAQLEEGEKKMLDYLIGGRFYAHTGVYDLFNYFDRYHKNILQHCPVMIKNQQPNAFLDTFLPDLHDLVFTLPKAKAPSTEKVQSIQDDIVWQFTVEVHNEKSKTIECHRGYFKLNEDYRTRIDLSKTINEFDVAWIRFQGYDIHNPQRRAWFQAFKGPMFNKINWTREVADKTVLNPTLTNVVHNMSMQVDIDAGEEVATYRPTSIFSPTSLPAPNLTFNLNKAINENHLCVYNLQVHSLKQRNDLDFASKVVPPTYLQNVCGVFQLSTKYPTKLDLNSSWDKATTKDNACSFYIVDENAKVRSLQEFTKAK
ncbi:uncharacterized protein [Clytia hemisphaerica]|uniref:Uncharacterized protein n=1 Tax=Clytia hemisphaerica TaxID=252671 RepID=A0A7M5X104_9CNID|eukprot:TCONS_00008896-protein